jgi:hypothetical protein
VFTSTAVHRLSGSDLLIGAIIVVALEVAAVGREKSIVPRAKNKLSSFM